MNNAGSPWKPEEELKLIKRFNSGKTVEEISKKHKRTEGAIIARLVLLNLVVQLPELHGYFRIGECVFSYANSAPQASAPVPKQIPRPKWLDDDTPAPF